MIEFQFISHYSSRYSYLDSIRLALEGGCRWIQLRMKGASDEDLHQAALTARQMCLEAGAKFIIDDNVMLAREINADGVHLGKNDMPVARAREILGKDFIIGGTANTFEDVLDHYRSGADYIGCGPFRFTSTKEKLSPVLGLEGYREIVGKMKAEGIDIPIVAIGGITYDDIPQIMQTGVTGIAVSGTILRAEDPVNETRKLLNLISNGKIGYCR